MTNGPGNTMPLVAAGQGLLRTSRADREHVVSVLQVAFVQGRLTQDEFVDRVGRALASRTYSELSPITADLPALLIGSQVARAGALTQCSVEERTELEQWAAIKQAASGRQS